MAARANMKDAVVVEIILEVDVDAMVGGARFGDARSGVRVKKVSETSGGGVSVL
jgi:hypothetical protein